MNNFSFHFIFKYFRRVAIEHRWFSRDPPLKGIYKLRVQKYRNGGSP